MLKKLTYLLIAALLGAVFMFLFRPIVDGPTSRSQAAEILIATGDARLKINEILKKRPHAEINLEGEDIIPSHIGSKNESGERIEIAFREISSRGEIKVFSPQLGVMFILTPAFNNGDINWTCWGRPKNRVPFACRESP